MDSLVGRDRRDWLQPEACSLDELRSLAESETRPDAVPLADEIVSRLPIYDGGRIRQAIDDADRLKAFMAEWNAVLATGPGAVVPQGDRSTAV